MISKSWRASAVLLAGVLAAACTTMGVGTGTPRGGGSPVDFTWTSKGSVSGTMTARVENTGETFTGNFFQVTSETQVDDLDPLWVGRWHRSWDWPYWGAGWGPNWGPSFVTQYSGRVLANLSSPNGDHMRCNFTLVNPASGMSGGGVGRCQLPGSEKIDATFPAAS